MIDECAKICNLIAWERLTGRPFPTFDPTCDDDITAWLYVTAGTSARSTTLDGYRAALASSPRVSRREYDRARRAAEWSRQWVAKESKADDAKDGKADGQPPTVAEAAYALIADGFDAAYLLQGLPYWELGDVARAFAAKRDRDEATWRASAEIWRTAAYAIVIPHVRRGTLKRPADLWRYPWEAEAKSRDAAADLKAHEDEFRRFMATGGPLARKEYDKTNQEQT